MTYTIKNTTFYRGGHAADPGYRSTVVIGPDRLREYHFYSDPDGNNVRRVGTRPTSVARRTDAFRKVAATAAAKRAPALEAAIKAHIAAHGVADYPA